MKTTPLRVLRNPNYRMYFAGQLISMSGSWVQSVAQSWLVYRLSQSGVWLGVIMFCSQIPAFILSPIAGAIADRADRKKILIAVQVMAMLQAFALAVLVFTGKTELWHIVVLAVALGIVSAFEVTTRHAFAVDMVGKSDLPAAIALNSVLMNGSRVFGPALAGVMIGWLGEGWCFLANGVSYIPVIMGLMAMKVMVPSVPRKATGREHEAHLPEATLVSASAEAATDDSDDNVITRIIEGVRYAKTVPSIVRLLALTSLVCIFSSPFSVLLPIFAKTVLRGDANTLAWLTGMVGVGAVTGALSTILLRGGFVGEGLWDRLGKRTVFWGVGLIVLGLSRSTWLSTSAAFLVGYFMMSFFPTVNNALQQVVDDPMRGRVLSLYTMTFLGGMPLGGFIMGWAADRIGAPAVVIVSGTVSIVVGLGALLMRSEEFNDRKMAT